MKVMFEVEELLREHGAVLLRQTTHKVFLMRDGRKFTIPVSASDHRAEANALAVLRREFGISREPRRKNPNRQEKQTAHGQALYRNEGPRSYHMSFAEKLTMAIGGATA